MARWLKRICLLAFGCFVLMPVGHALAALPYETYSYDPQGKRFPVQPAYMPDRVIGPGPGGLAWNTPEDLAVDRDNRLYVADSLNNRVVRLNAQYEPELIIGDQDGPGKLNNPQGVFVADDGTIYVADTGHARIVLYRSDGSFVWQYGKPESGNLPDDFRFEPAKLAVDGRGYMYIALRNGYQGLLLMDGERGEFQGFFGANRVSFHLLDLLKRRLFTKEQLAKEVSKLPGAVSNVTVDGDGLIYTSSIRVETGQLKKLSYSGTDLLGEKVYGERNIQIGQERLFVDLAVDRDGIMTAVDGQSGVIYQYDPQGELLFAFGARNEGFNKMGLVNYPSAIAVDSDGKLYVLDKTANMIHVFRPTAFALEVHRAIGLFLDGKYEESEQPWREILHMNSKYYKAHLGLGKSDYKKGMWEDAMREFRAARYVTGYSEAFWQARLVYLQTGFSTIASVVLGGAALVVGFRRYVVPRIRPGIKRGGGRSGLPAQLGHVLRILRHPVDGFWELRFERKGGIGAALILVVLLGLVALGSQVATGYIFRQTEVNAIDPLVTLLKFAIPLATWIVSNYLVGSITQGQARFVDVAVGSCYALAPYLVLALPIAVLSSGLTLGEAVVYQFLHTVMLGWTGFLFIVFVKEVHNYELGEAIRNIVLTLLFAVAMWIVILIFFGMSTQLFDFVSQIFEEVRVRG